MGDVLEMPFLCSFNRNSQTKSDAMKTYQECVKECDDNIPHKTDVYMGGFLDAIAFVFNKKRAQVIKDITVYRTERNFEEDEA